MRGERISDEVWETRIRPNLASLDTEKLLELNRAISKEDYLEVRLILAKYLKEPQQPVLLKHE